MQRVKFGGAELVVPPGAVTSAVEVGVSRLSGEEVPRLDAGLSNVTGGVVSGFRFTPHPLSFAVPVEVTLPYDPALLAAGGSADDVRTYFFDEVAGCWKALERVSVDVKAHTVTSRTDHFTDMINATAAVPEHAENVSFNPNQLKGIQAGDPGSKVNLVSVPGASGSGDNATSYPIEVPAGRGGLQPSVGVGYSSAAGNGWVGVGWDLGTPAVSVDTRWGVPRFDAVKETETYLFGGQMLTPVAHRGPAVARSAGDKVFRVRVEGGFAKIVRKGTNPKAYSWEVTDKSGVVSVYGTAGAVLADDDGNGFRWALREVRDRHGNFVRYHYAQVDDAGVGSPGALMGRELYPSKITYTGSGSVEGKYSVEFKRDRELGEALRGDKTIDARGGFKRVVADRLRKVEVKFDGALVRRYELSYVTGAFGKSLLQKITQFDANGAEFNKHEFTYFDDVRDSQGNYDGFDSKAWSVPGDGLANTALNLTGENAGNASVLGTSKSSSGGGHFYFGVGEHKGSSTGVKVGYSDTSSDGVLALVDVDGDNLPDKVFRSGGVVKYRKNLSVPGGPAKFDDSPDAVKALDLPDGFSSEHSESLTLGPEGYRAAGALQLNYVNTFATTDRYFLDVNADGIADVVNGTSVLFGRVGSNGVPVYGVSGDSPVPVTSGTVDTANLFGDFAGDVARFKQSFPLLDTVRVWKAQAGGTVRVLGGVKLDPATLAARAASKTADGVKVSVEYGGQVRWSQQLDANDRAEYPIDVSFAVAKGESVFFRVQSISDGSLDQVVWNNLRVTYPGVPGGSDPNGLSLTEYRQAGDFTLAGRTSEVTVPVNGTLKLDGDFHLGAAVSDDVKVQITRDGVPVLEQTITSGTSGAGATVPVDVSLTVTAGQKLKWNVLADSPVDVSKVAWSPRAYYTAASGVDSDKINDANGQPRLVLAPVPNVSIYPLSSADGSYPGVVVPVAPAGDCVDVTFTPSITVDENAIEESAGRVSFTVKRKTGTGSAAKLFAKHNFEVVHNQVAQPSTTLTKKVCDQDGGTFYLEFSKHNEVLGRTVTTSAQYNNAAAGSVVNTATADGLLPGLYRGWGAVGYNPAGDAANSPISTQKLYSSPDVDRDDFPSDDFDPQAEKDAFEADPKVDVPKVSVPFYPDVKNNRWGSGDRSWVSAEATSSSRLGAAAIAVPGGAEYAGATAVPRVSQSKTISLTGSVAPPGGSLGGGVGRGTSTSLVDFMDLNGDGFPDVVGTNGIQYTDASGKLGAVIAALPDVGARKTSTASGNAGAGSAGRTLQTGAGTADASGTASAKTAKSGGDMPPLGLGLDLSGSESDANYDLIDVNGDGLPDRVYGDSDKVDAAKRGKVSLNLGYKFAPLEAWRNPAPLNDGSGRSKGLNIGFNTDFYGFAGGASFEHNRSTTGATLADVNGDGLADRVFAGAGSNDPIRVGFNTGNGFEPAVAFGGSKPGVAADRNASLGGGLYGEIPACFFFACLVFNPGVNSSVGVARTEQALRDINGDGLVDHVSSTADNGLSVEENTTGRTNLLKAVSRPLGASMQFDYSRDGNTYAMPQSKWVLSSVTVNDGHAGDGQDTQLSTFEYSGGVYDRLEREFRGYATVVAKTRDTGNGNAVVRSTTSTFRTDSHYTMGLPVKTIVANASGDKFTESENSYTIRNIDTPGGAVDLASTTATLFPFAHRTDKRFYEGQATPGKATFTTADYDTRGNLTTTIDTGEAGAADDVATTIGYTDCPATGIDVADHLTVTVAGVVKRERESTIDCGNGELTQTRSKLNATEVAVSDMTYDASGNLSTVEGAPNKANQRSKLTYTYDTTVGTYVTSVTDNAFNLTSSSTYDFKFGLPLTSTDTNGKTVTNTYDALGRLDTVTGPYEAGTGKVTIDVDYHPEAVVPYAVTRHIDKQADGTYRTDTIDTITFVDGLGRAVQVKKDAAIHTGETTPAADKMTVSGKTEYDGLGRAVKQYYPVTEPKGAANTTFNTAVDTVQPTVTTYDALDRATRTTLPDNTFATVGFGFGADRAGVTQFETVATDANNKAARSYTDVRGRATAVKQFNPAGGATQAVIWTSFGYNALGEKTSVTDNDDNTTTIAFDNLGRNTAVTSPDSGRTDFVYDLAGNLVKKHTAKLATSDFIEYDYDYTRLKKIRYPLFNTGGLNGTGNDVTYTYGAPGAPDNAAGRVTSITDGAGTKTLKYGPLGETTEETRTVQDNGNQTATFTTRYQFDSWNRVLKMTYPDGEVLTYGYDSAGNVNAATGAKATDTYTYLSRLDYDKFGQRKYVVTGNGTRTAYTYDSLTQRLGNLKASLATSIASGHTFQNVDYTYDNVGNITKIQDTAAQNTAPAGGSKIGGPSTENYTYDDLYRLTTATGTYQPAPGKTDTYNLTFSYDKISNITNKTQTRSTGTISNPQPDDNLTYNNTYTYSTPGKPHAASTIGIHTLGYDAAGNLISRNQQQGPRRQLVWDEENRLACTHENVQNQTIPQTAAGCDNAGGSANARYLYDDHGQRIVKKEAKYSFYPNQNYSTNGSNSYKHIYIGATKLLTKEVDKNHHEDAQYYNHADNLGSTGWTTDATGKIDEHIKYLPGGETWTHENPSQPVDHQYNGKEYDSQTGLYYYGARYYDPRLTTWQSTDPALPSTATNTTSLSTYLYANANPINYTDPDGR
ncbi:SpvB/TcaC N-terminal domain-containing protein, partial [Kribbella ginsengisoli]|uniref:SpvB/TcaC N-terminal domain-containing protein n=1 Tax=Kribbella ginsengisoli TaxID=363865 RepID=UPI0031CF2662